MTEVDEKLDDRASEIASSTWNKMERDLKQFGFREGATEGREGAFQTGFDQGYLDGFEMGERLGVYRGVLSSMKQINPSKLSNISQEEIDLVEDASKGYCRICPASKSQQKSALDEKFYQYDLKDLSLVQKEQNDSLNNVLDALQEKLEKEKG